MNLIDLKNEKNNSHLTRLTELTAWIRDNEVHRNKKNYINLESTIVNFDCFEILYDKNKIVGFSGLYNNSQFPKNIARSCTRTYYHPDYRCKGLNRARWSEKYFIPYEIEKAKEKGYDYVFISIELLIRRRSMIDLVNYLNTNNSTGHKWILHPEICNTCRTYNNEGTFIGINNDVSCWQNICYANISNTTLPFKLPSISIDEYKKKYHKEQLERIKLLR